MNKILKMIVAMVLSFAIAPALFGQNDSSNGSLNQDADPPAENVPPKPENRDVFPNLNIYLPEMEMDLRARKLIRNVLFESQINYHFVDGDISTYLRYKYYARDFTYRFGVFDTIEFAAVETGSRDFGRVRGGFLLFEKPRNYNQRYFWLMQLDGLTYGDTRRPDNNSNNVYTKIAYQQGTTFDARLNSIAGESRGRIAPVLTAHRDIGPQKLGFAVALTKGFEGLGDYNYIKFEGETVKRWDVTADSFVISRLHAGTFLQKEDRVIDPNDPDPLPENDDDDILEQYPYDLPRYELFKLGGRDLMKGVDGHTRGTDEVHFTNELFVPIFRDRDYRKLGASWNNLYGIGYAGVGNIGFDTDAFTDFGDYVIDAGLGFEASLIVRNFEVFMNLVYAQTVKARDELESHEIRFSVRTSR